MLRSYLVASAQKAVRRRMLTEKREQRQKEFLESRLIEAEETHKHCQASLLAQIDALQQELKNAGGHNALLAHEVEDLRASLTAAQKLAEEMEQQVQHVQTLHEAKIQQLEKDTQEQTVRFKETEEMKERYEALKARILESELRSQDALELRKRYETLKENHEDLKHNNDKLREKLSEQDARTQEASELRKRYETLKANSEELRQNHEQLKEKLIENENFLRTQEGKVAARFEKQLAEARCQCAQAKADCDDFEASLETCKRQLQNAREQNAKLRACLEESEEVADKENRDTSHTKPGFISNLLGVRRTLQLGHYK